MQTGSQTALDRVITNWTGMNGYEEFVQAAILARTIDAGDFHRYSRSPDRQEHPQGLPAWLQKTEDFLSGEELSAKRFKPVLKMIRFGLNKPVAYPNKTILPSTLFPELAFFRGVPVMFESSSYAAFAHGDEREGASEIAQALLFCEKQPYDIRLLYFVRAAMTKVVISHLMTVIPSLSQVDCEKLTDGVSQLLDSPKKIIEGYEGEHQMTMAGLDDILNLREPLTRSDSELSKLLRQLSIDDKAVIRDYAASIISGQDQSLVDLLARPESEWGVNLVPISPPDFNLAYPNASFQARAFAKLIVPMVSDDPTQDIGTMFAINRTQIRLMALPLRIAAFRWEFDRYPETLLEVVGREASVDPLTGRDFIYRRTSDGYELYSEGFKGKGKIEVSTRWKSAFSDRLEINP